jgi:hypothetical protein
MPEIEFYITDDEKKELFDYVTNNDGAFVPDLWYNKPQGIRIQSKTEFVKCIDNLKTSFFVISPYFQIEPLMFRGFGKDGEKWDVKLHNYIMQCFQAESFIFAQHMEKKGQHEGKYYINQRHGGPYIHFLFSRGYADDAPIKYKCTEFFHYPSYIHYNDFETFERFPATKELKTYYRMIVKFLKAKCRQITAKDGEKYWVSKTLKEGDVV